MDRESDVTRPWSGTLEKRDGWHVAEYDPTTRSPSEVVVFALAAVAEAEPETLRPLNDSIDPDALDSLFARTINGRPRGAGQVTFVHDGYTVFVTYDGEVRLRCVTDAAGGGACETTCESDD